MNPSDLVKLIEILNPTNKPGRITIITRMGAENMRVKLPHLIRAVRNAGQIVTWITDPMHGNTIKAPCGLKTRPFDSILVCAIFSTSSIMLLHLYDAAFVSNLHIRYATPINLKNTTKGEIDVIHMLSAVMDENRSNTRAHFLNELIS